jgi:hypothetical protein
MVPNSKGITSVLKFPQGGKAVALHPQNAAVVTVNLAVAIVSLVEESAGSMAVSVEAVVSVSQVQKNLVRKGDRN